MSTEAKPTIVLVHGAFAESGGWGPVADRLQAEGYGVIAAANPLRSVASDAAQVRALVDSIEGKVVLVGHSYGGMVISKAAAGAGNVTSLVYVAGFAPEEGESGVTLAGQFPGSTLADTLRPVSLPDGNEDMYVAQELYRNQFAADVPEKTTRVMAATQRPITAAALSEPAQGPQAWKTLPTFFLIAEADKNIPAQAHHFMAGRAGGDVVSVEGASHAVFASHPEEVADLILRAAKS
ncbi:alpha/beta hydrolase [Streptomyces hygroscopicus subsp. jinggangensis 5008]|nr:alpha/beta hydrolase [Streptomyces hygroscopicus subsp. jinggangensis 5008]AEY85509.1 alpha/beta hydrolase [Streptomyces hygroscopicus subsp. jinggangensis 5008]AGF59724.1 Alpha/beta hydrolase [Streptomyces hygroscopicus subsp. jinggangensis TL01]